MVCRTPQYANGQAEVFFLLHRLLIFIDEDVFGGYNLRRQKAIKSRVYKGREMS